MLQKIMLERSMVTDFSSGIRTLMDYARDKVVRSQGISHAADLLAGVYSHSDPSDRRQCRAVLEAWLTGHDLDLRIVASEVVIRADIQDLSYRLP